MIFGLAIPINWHRWDWDTLLYAISMIIIISYNNTVITHKVIIINLKSYEQFEY